MCLYVRICMYVSNACVHENDFRRKTNSWRPITEMEGLSSLYLGDNYYTYVYMYIHVYVYNTYSFIIPICMCVCVCLYVCVHVFVNILI